MESRFRVFNKICGITIIILSWLLLLPSCSYWHEVNLKYEIPEGYEGLIIIAWDQEDGQEKIMEDDYEVYKVPSTGILRTQVPARNMTILDEQFYS